MLGAPRRGVASPSPRGKIALISTSQYSFQTRKTSSWLQLLDLDTGAITDSGFNASQVNEVAWIPGTETGIVYINGTNDKVLGGVTLWTGNISDPSSRLVSALSNNSNAHTEWAAVTW
jgi:hypothetical protein